MMQQFLMTRRSMLFSLVGLMLTALLTVWGCGGSGSTGSGSYPIPVTPQPAAALETADKTSKATADDLKTWINSGYLNNNSAIASKASTISKAATSSSAAKLVILAVTTPADYLNGHIPGAQLLNSATEINQTRLEGVAQIGTQTPDGTIIDPIIKRSGIDANTTIVFTVSKKGSFLNAARAYYIFRYWGFAKERLKILDGGDDAWVDAGNTLTTEAPVITPSTYSVKNNTNNFQLRSSIGDMISLVDGINQGTISNDVDGVAILDVRGPTNGVLPTVYMANAKVDDFAQYTTAISGKTSKYNDAESIKTHLATFGVAAQTKMTYVYCASGTRAASTFFVLDGILNWPVTLYDGSWNQWGQYFFNTSTGQDTNKKLYSDYNLPSASPWRVDINTPGTTKARTTGTMLTNPNTSPAVGTALALDPVALAMYTTTDPRANQMKIADLLYITPVVTTTPTTPSGGGSASGC